VSAHVQRADPADGVVMLTITRPEMRNALAQQSWFELRRAAEDIAADPRVRALAWCSPDASEARQAFLEKHSPRFNLDVATER
jgi:1,4-dihydroxy-2-naphthoyl-CoA synthase